MSTFFESLQKYIENQLEKPEPDFAKIGADVREIADKIFHLDPEKLHFIGKVLGIPGPEDHNK